MLVSELRSFAILPHAALFVKPFFDFFQTFSALPPFCTPVPDSSVNIASLPLFVKTFFVFFKFFSPNGLGHTRLHSFTGDHP